MKLHLASAIISVLLCISSIETSSLVDELRADADGLDVGDGRLFAKGSRKFLGSTKNKVGSGQCCQECTNLYPDTNLFTYNKWHKACYCHKRIPNTLPVTVLAPGFINGVCEERNECYDYDIEYTGTTLNNGHQTKISSALKCQQLCRQTKGCIRFTWIRKPLPSGTIFSGREGECWLKDSTTYTKQSFDTTGVISGPALCERNVCYEYDIEYIGTTLNNGYQTKLSSALKCQQLCQKTNGCILFTWVASSGITFSGREGECWLKDSTTGKKPSYDTTGLISGPASCG